MTTTQQTDDGDDAQRDNWTRPHHYGEPAKAPNKIGEVFEVTGHYTAERHEQMGGDQLVIETDRGDLVAPNYYDAEDIDEFVGEVVQLVDDGSAESGPISKRRLRLQTQ